MTSPPSFYNQSLNVPSFYKDIPSLPATLNIILKILLSLTFYCGKKMKIIIAALVLRMKFKTSESVEV